MAAQRKRKHTSDDGLPSKPTFSQPLQQNIKVFGSIGKATEPNECSKRRKTAHQREPTPPPPSLPNITSVKTDKKRKRDLATVEEDDEDVVHDGSNESRTGNNGCKPSTNSRKVVTPRNKRFKNVRPPSPAETPSKSTAALFMNLKLDVNTKAVPFTLPVERSAYDSPPLTPGEDSTPASRFPDELDHLVQLHAAFLSALSLHYAHNGTSQPVNMKVLLHMIAKHWKKRAVTLDDVRLVLGFTAENDSSYVLQDFGRAGICLTKLQPRGRAVKRAASFVDEVDLNARFEHALQKRWTAWLAFAAKENQDVSAFLKQLPPADVKQAESVEKAAPFFGRGQQRLADIKASQAAANARPGNVPSKPAERDASHAAQNRGTSLLDRVVARQALTASLPAGPTKEQLERKAALHRIEDIARILDLLAAGRSRCSFSMQAIIQQLQQSLRNPISREEVDRCLNLMAKEIMPGFVSLLQSGAVSGVVVTKGGKVGLEELRQRLQRAGA